jgi:type II secretory ATPase GspE/PulE/Tfp pilus assembly ATPase PilB-like protein
MQTSSSSSGVLPVAMGSAGAAAPADGLASVMDRVVFLKQLQQVSNRIHSTDNLSSWQLDMAQEICELLQADRMTLYEAEASGHEIVSRIKMGLNKLKDIRLPVDERSVAGYVAATRQTLNIHNAYDTAELQRISPNLNFHKGVDNFTGYRSRQMLVVPLVQQQTLLGVLQLINFKGTGPFPPMVVDGAREVAQTLAVAMLRRRQAQGPGPALGSAGASAAPGVAKPQPAEAVPAVGASSAALTPPRTGEQLAATYGVPYEPFKSNRVKPTELLRNLRREFAESSGWVPLEEGLTGIVVVCTDPDRTRASKVVVNVYNKRKIDYRVTTEEEFERFLQDYFGDSNKAAASVSDLLSDLSDTDDSADNPADEVSAAADNELVRLVNRIVVEAYQQGASDIHVEPRPGKGKTIIRLRRDGVLVNYIEVPAAFRNALVTRIKIMCDLDIAEKRRPQDGKIKFRKFGPLDIELRVATIPTAGGTEDVVMRILAAGKPLPLDDIGLSTRNLQQLRGCVEKPYGLFLVCGPTGSGKTTTLHSVLAHLNKPDTKIWTAEDPVEITQDGLRQVQVNRKAGLDFVAVMRAFLRADPDIIMVGEMRDAETAGTGIEASLTGHLVMSTLHTNSAVESVIRLLDMGMDPFNFADALLGILAQRLARRLCKDCKEAYEPSAAELNQLLDEFCTELTHTPTWKADAVRARQAVQDQWAQQFTQDDRYQLYRAKGCPACQDTGYRGRIALHELLVASDGVKLLIQEKAKVPEILAVALGDGMRTLKMDGIEKVLQGITDVHRVREVCIK